ncbi:MAG: hypothetical protein QXS81_01010 [Candidatus Micrarchaeaceae archaeon]
MAQIESFEDNEPKKIPNTAEVNPKRKKRESIPLKQPKPAEEERLTAEEWEERLKAEEEAKSAKTQQPKMLTREEFMEMKAKSKEAQNQPASAQAQAQPKRRVGFIDILEANMNEALGVVPNPAAATTNPAPKVQIPAEASNLQELGREGVLSSMQQNPIVSGIFALTGLIVMLIGTFSHVIEATLTLEVIGFIIFIFGLVFIIKYLLRKK